MALVENDGTVQYGTYEGLVVAFRQFDTEGSGLLTKEDLKAMCERATKDDYKEYDLLLPDDEIDDMLSRYDVDGDGKLCIEEFCRAWSQLTNIGCCVDVASIGHSYATPEERQAMADGADDDVKEEAARLRDMRAGSAAFQWDANMAKIKREENPAAESERAGTGDGADDQADEVEPSTEEQVAETPTVYDQLTEEQQAEVSELTGEQVADFKSNFDVFDEGATGAIPTEKLVKVMHSLSQYLTKAEVQAMIDEVDAEGSGTIQFPIFLYLIARNIKASAGQDTEADLLEAFKAFDQDGSGFLDAAELRDAMTNLGEQMTDEEVDEMLKNADIDGDGKINYDEFARMMLSTDRVDALADVETENAEEAA